MKIIADKTSFKGANGKRRLVVELDAGEVLVPIKADGHYQLGSPMDDMVINGRILQDMTPVCWDSLEQKWM